MRLISEIIQATAETDGCKLGEGSLFTRTYLSGQPELLAAYNQGISNGIARRIADDVEAGNKRANPESLENWLNRRQLTDFGSR